jgi:hypothetical protein
MGQELHTISLLTAFLDWPGKDTSPHMEYFILFLRALHLSFGTESWTWLQSAINQPAFLEQPPGN